MTDLANLFDSIAAGIREYLRTRRGGMTDTRALMSRTRRADPKRSCERCGCRFDPNESQCPVCGQEQEDEIEQARRLAV